MGDMHYGRAVQQSGGPHPHSGTMHVAYICCIDGGRHHSTISASMHSQDCTNLQLPALQIWDYISGKLKKDLQYQAEEQFMLHDTAVLALAFSSNSDILVSGSQDGKIKVGCAINVVEEAPCLVVQLVKWQG